MKNCFYYCCVSESVRPRLEQAKTNTKVISSHSHPILFDGRDNDAMPRDEGRARVEQDQSAFNSWIWIGVGGTIVLLILAVLVVILFINKKRKDQWQPHEISSRRFNHRTLSTRSSSTSRRHRETLISHQESSVDIGCSRLLLRSEYTDAREDKNDNREDGSTGRPVMHANSIAPDRIKLGKQIGGGHFGQVFRATLTTTTTTTATSNGQRTGTELAVAVKVIRSKAFGFAAIDELLHEADIMASFDHPNILKTHGVVHGRK